MFSVVAVRVSLIFLENQTKHWEHGGKEKFLGDILYFKKIYLFIEAVEAERILLGTLMRANVPGR